MRFIFQPMIIYFFEILDLKGTLRKQLVTRQSKTECARCVCCIVVLVIECFLCLSLTLSVFFLYHQPVSQRAGRKRNYKDMLEDESEVSFH